MHLRLQAVSPPPTCDVNYLDNFPSTSKEPNAQDCLHGFVNIPSLKNIYISEMKYIIINSYNTPKHENIIELHESTPCDMPNI